MGLEASLRRRQVPGHAVWVLGYGERGVTVRNQQIRAINVVRGLAEVERLPRATTRLAIIGAGPSGLTAAAAALLEGFEEVRVFEADALVATLCKANHRLIHPRLYDWPEPGWQHAGAGLPLLDWVGANGQQVSDRIAAGWSALSQWFHPACPIRCSCVVDDLVQRGDSYVLVEKGVAIWRADAVLVACGWGHGTQGYWDPDDLPAVDADEVVLCGAGDSALVDLFRVVFMGFEQQSFLANLERAAPEGARQLADDVRAIEAGLSVRPAAGASPGEREAWLAARSTAWAGLAIPDEVKEFVASKLRRAVGETRFRPPKVALSFREEDPFHASSFALNRAILAALLATVPDRLELRPSAHAPVANSATTRAVVRFGSELPVILRCPLLEAHARAELAGSDPSSVVAWTDHYSPDEGARQWALLERIARARGAMENPFVLMVTLLHFLDQDRAAAVSLVAGGASAPIVAGVRDELVSQLQGVGSTGLLLPHVFADLLRAAWQRFRLHPEGAALVARALADAIEAVLGDSFWEGWEPGMMPAHLPEALPVGSRCPPHTHFDPAFGSARVDLVPSSQEAGIRFLPRRLDQLTAARRSALAALPRLAVAGLDTECPAYDARGAPRAAEPDGTVLCTPQERLLFLAFHRSERPNDLHMALRLRPSALVFV
ncbi:MAG: hypothetical protein Q8P41_08500 [Pseudomonadota bacterium]|nr:hypothetical protein [Pseudomonadota bacterium]